MVLAFWGWCCDGWLIVFLGGGVLGVSVFVLCLLQACSVRAIVLLGCCWWVCLWGCGVVVWELYSEREHLADEMSLMTLFPWVVGCLSLVCVILLDCFIAQF